jgi:leucyl-tRNA synthetase
MENFQKIEQKWQKLWEESKIFDVNESKKKKFYCLEMFPYPSASGLHIGHTFNYIIGDIYARFKIMQGFNVLHPMGYDSFGLPAENAAIKSKIHPKKYTENSIKNFIKQQKKLGITYDWSRLIKTSDPEYYKWNQYFFIQFFKNGLIYRKEAPVNWCPKCETVLANEQVSNGKCWRHQDTDVIEKNLEQWFIKTTKYAEELLKFLPKLNWPEKIKLMQKNWIGKSHGTMVKFKLKDSDEEIEVFTTRPDTLYGVTFLVYSIQHPKVKELIKNTKEEKKVLEFLKNLPKQTPEEKEKEGVFIGRYAINPLTNEEVPIYASNFVVADYATGIVMAVPAHDQRDFEFAKKYNIPIKIVIQNKDKTLTESSLKKAYTEPGILVNSGQFNNLDSETAKEKITQYLKKKKLGYPTIQYKLKDWLVSRQRYWGTPIPIIYCNNCGIVPVPEKDLPVELPEKVTFGKGNPLATNKNFLEVKCPKCKSIAKRETDTMDTFFDSSWYFLRYCDPKNNIKPFDSKKTSYWMPVDFYTGGAEHACMHLIYARVFTKMLRDLNFINLNEPFTTLFNQGMIHGEDGYVMSKSRGNVVDPLDVIKKYSADSLRLFLVSVASPDKDFSWSSTGIESVFKFLKRVYNYVSNVKLAKSSPKVENKINKAIKEVTQDIENLQYNLAIIKLRKLFDSLENEISKKDLESFLKLLTPFCPHLAEELWEKIGNKPFISISEWPSYDPKKINPELDAQEELLENTIQDIRKIISLTKIKPKKITIITAHPWKYDLFKKVKKQLEKTHNVSEIIKAVITKVRAKEISKIVPSLVKDPSKIPFTILSEEKEFNFLTNNKDQIKKEFKTEIEIKKNGDKALPGKPQIIIE